MRRCDLVQRLILACKIIEILRQSERVVVMIYKERDEDANVAHLSPNIPPRNCHPKHHSMSYSNPLDYLIPENLAYMSSTYIAVYESIQSVNENIVRLFQGNDSILLDPEQEAMLSELDVSHHDATALDDINNPFCGKSYYANNAVQNVMLRMRPVSYRGA